MKRINRVSQLTLELYNRGLATRKERKQVEKALGQVTPPALVVFRRKKAVVITAIAAILLCAIIPTFFYLKGKNSNKENAIAESSVSETETTEGLSLGDDEEIEGLELISYDENRFNFEKKTETPVKSDGVTIAAVPETEVRTRGSKNVQQPVPSDEQSNIAIPPGLTFIFENMFANKQLTAVVIPERITSIAKNAFAGNPLVSVTIGANVNVHDEAIPGNFAKAYNNYGKTAGTYTRSDVNSEEWRKK
jgi:hypothetical protein